MSDRIAVVLLKRLSDNGGGLIQPGETASFDRADAERLVQRGVARYPTPAPEERAPAGPPADKMIAGAQRKRAR